MEIIYLLYRRYWFYALVMMSFTTIAIFGLMKTLHEQHAKLVGLVNRRRVVPIVQEGWIRAALSYELVPGDVIVLQRGKATCDMVLLRGSCLVEESTLSGEVQCGADTLLCCDMHCAVMCKCAVTSNLLWHPMCCDRQCGGLGWTAHQVGWAAPCCAVL